MGVGRWWWEMGGGEMVVGRRECGDGEGCGGGEMVVGRWRWGDDVGEMGMAR